MSDDRDTPKSPVPPSFDDDEERTLNGVEDVPKPMRKWAAAHSRRIRRVEKWNEDGGVLWRLDRAFDAFSQFISVFKWLGPMIGGFVVTIVVAIVWLLQHAATQPPPATPEQVAHEVEKHLQK